MGRVNSLLNKNLKQFLIYTVIILLCSTPLFFFIMKHFYAGDLDELIEYRAAEFVDTHLAAFTISEIEHWNHFNEDMQIFNFDASYPLNDVVQKPLYNSAEGHPVDYRIVYTKVNIEDKPFILMSRIAMIETKDLIQMLAVQYGILFLILVVAFTFIQRKISNKLWQPFYDSLAKIENFNLEQGITPEFEQTNITEFARLNENLDRLLKNDVKAYTQQKEFVENASHELQTPIAILQSQLDLLLQDSELTESQTQVIQSLYSVTSRLTRLNKNLLLLAKIDNSQFKEVQELDFSQLIATQLVHLKALAENEGISLSIEINNPLIISANKTLLESLVNNLIVNAIRHNREKGSITIRVEGRSFSISNTGEEKALNEDKIFRRFSRTTEEKKGNGLGLAIAAQICRLHQWQLGYSYSDNRHTFTIAF